MPLEGRMNNFEFIKADDTCELTSWRIVKPYNWHTTDGRWAPFFPPLVSNFERDKMSCYDDMNDRGGKKSRVHVTHALAHAHTPDLSENSRMRAHASIVPALLAVSPSPSRRGGEYRRPRPSPIQIRRPFWNSSKAASLLANRARSRRLDSRLQACMQPTDGRTDGRTAIPLKVI